MNACNKGTARDMGQGFEPCSCRQLVPETSPYPLGNAPGVPTDTKALCARAVVIIPVAKADQMVRVVKNELHVPLHCYEGEHCVTPILASKLE
jgi:hypothetical protein